MGVQFDPDCHKRNPPSQAHSRPGSIVRPLRAGGSAAVIGLATTSSEMQ